MPFGISCAGEVAQKMVEKHFGDISGALLVFDDIIIGGKSEEEHDLILRKVLTIARERNIKFNRDKIQFRVNQVKYMGEVVSELGFSPDLALSLHEMYCGSIGLLLEIARSSCSHACLPQCNGL